MKRVLALALAGLGLLALTPAPSEGGWGGGGCGGFGPPPAIGPVGPAPVFTPPPPPPPPLLWVDAGDQFDLMQGGAQVGAWDGKTFRFRQGAGWGEPCSPPILPPVLTQKAPACGCDPCGCKPSCECGREPKPVFGVESNKVHPGRHYVDGREVSREQFFQAMTDGVPDDAGKLRLTVIGPKAERDAVTAALRGPLASYQDKYLLQEYEPGSWATACGFKQDGHPSVYLQDPKGKVLWRQDGASVPDLEEGLRTALRTPDPDYDPTKDPGPHNRPKPIGPNSDPQSLVPWGLVALVALLIFKKK